MEYSENYLKALEYAAKKHKGQYRKGGEEYITHPVAVAAVLENKGYNEDYLIAALFHDLLEDTDASEDELLMFCSSEVLQAIKLVTKEKNYSQKDYIERIKNNPIAFAVKGADRLHNCLCAVDADEAFRKRYIKDTAEWYLDFDSGILPAIKALAESLSEPISEYPFLYE